MQKDCSVLIVEDDPDDIFLMKRALRAAGATTGRAPRISTAQNGQDAICLLGVLEERRELPHCVTLDLNMPVMDGIGFLKVLRATPKLRDLKTIVVTTSMERHIHAGALKAGADEIWVKPRTEAELFGIAEHALAHCPC
jgi:CheY-like chemotaxis protein